MAKKKFFLIIDVEGTGDADKRNQLPYDVGGAVMARNGEIVETFSFVNSDIFCDGRLMATAYYANKSPEYLSRLYRGETKPATTGEIFRHMADVMDRYGISEIWAYNVNYDCRALWNAAHAFKRNFTPEEIRAAVRVVEATPKDIWRAAAEVLYGYHYCKFCRANGYETDKGNIRTGAEFGYRYLTGDTSFEEEHRGLDDVLIEAHILKRVLDQHKKFDATPSGFLHKKVMKKEKHGNKGKKRKRV